MKKVQNEIFHSRSTFIGKTILRPIFVCSVGITSVLLVFLGCAVFPTEYVNEIGLEGKLPDNVSADSQTVFEFATALADDLGAPAPAHVPATSPAASFSAPKFRTNAYINPRPDIHSITVQIWGRSTNSFFVAERTRLLFARRFEGRTMTEFRRKQGLFAP
jgi:hypothetical protein